MNFLKNTFFPCVLAALVFLAGCATIRYVPIKETQYVSVRDTTYLRDTLVRVELEKARLADFVDLGDTLVLSTDLARSTAFLDTTSGKLKGTLENTLKYVEKPVQIRERLVYRDSVEVREVPVEVEKPVKYVPKFWKIFGILGILSLVAAVLYILKKIGIIQF